MRISKHLLGEGFTILILLLATSALSTLLMNPISPEQVAGGSPAWQMLWSFMYAIILFRAAGIRTQILATLRRNQFLVALVVLAMISSLWSQDVGTSLRRSIANALSTLFAIDFATRYPLKKQIQLVSVTVAIAIVSSICIEVLLPGLIPKAVLGNVTVAKETWNGIFSHKNIFGHVLALGVVCVLANSRRTVKSILLSTFSLIVIFVGIAGAQSRTSLLISLLMLVLWCTLSILHWRARVLRTLGVAVTLGVVCMCYVGYEAADTFARLLDRTSDLTGRTEIWVLALDAIWRRPIFGYGFSGFWFVSEESTRIQSILGWDTPYAHNAYIDITLQLGFVGLALCLAVVAIGLKRAVEYTRRLRTSSSIWPLACILFSLTYGITESDFLTSNWLFWMMFVAAVCTVSISVPQPATVRIPPALAELWPAGYGSVPLAATYQQSEKKATGDLSGAHV